MSNTAYNSAVPEWIGRTIGRVRIDQLLAHGGMAEVYLGTHLTLDRPVAVKVLHSYVEDDQDLRERLEREAKVVAGFRHPNIVQVYDFDMIEGHPFIVMEYLNGPTLAVYLRDLHRRGERLPTQEVLQLLRGPASALDYAHGLGVVHRDVKPGNIMLHGVPEDPPSAKAHLAEPSAVMTDFGLVHVTGATHQTSIGTIAGTPNYMSPEQASGNPVDFRSDIYSLGVVLYEMLAGRSPFDGDSTLTVMYKQINEPVPPIDGISAKEQAVIARALAKRPDDRYQSCHELAVAFEDALSEPTRGRTVRAAGATMMPASMRDNLDSTAGGSAVTVHREPPVAAAAENGPRQRSRWILSAAFAAAGVILLAIGALVLVPKLAGASEALKAETAAPTVNASAPSADGLPSGDNMVKIPAGEYQVGLDAPDDFHGAQQTISLPEFWIDKYLVTNSEYQAYINQVGANPPQVWPGEPKHPIRGVTWDEANAYCTWMKKRLPSEAEWEVAGRGPAGQAQLFPWGDDPTGGGQVLQMPDQDTYDIGSLRFNVSPFGVFDLVGDVWQWVGEAYANPQPGSKILRGGRFGLPQDLAYRVVLAPDDTRYVKFAGFRCAASRTK